MAKLYHSGSHLSRENFAPCFLQIFLKICMPGARKRPIFPGRCVRMRTGTRERLAGTARGKRGMEHENFSENAAGASGIGGLARAVLCAGGISRGVFAGLSGREHKAGKAGDAGGAGGDFVPDDKPGCAAGAHRRKARFGTSGAITGHMRPSARWRACG